MGNCLRVRQGNMVEIVKPDGKVLEYRNRVKVCKVLADFSGYGLSENLRQPPLWQLLQPETTLHCGRSYYLVPLPTLNSQPRKKKKVRFVEDSSVDQLEDSTVVQGIRDTVVSSSGEVMRIKMVVRKKELVEMMERGIRDEMTCRILRFRDRSTGQQEDNGAALQIN